MWTYALVAVLLASAAHGAEYCTGDCELINIVPNGELPDDLENCVNQICVKCDVDFSVIGKKNITIGGMAFELVDEPTVGSAGTIELYMDEGGDIVALQEEGEGDDRTLHGVLEIQGQGNYIIDECGDNCHYLVKAPDSMQSPTTTEAP